MIFKGSYICIRRGYEELSLFADAVRLMHTFVAGNTASL